jgi:hypothetical protein
LDRAAWPFSVTLLIAGVTRLAFPFDGLYGQDAFAYFRFARAIGPHLRDGAPLPALFWPRGYPAAVAALLPLTGDGPLAGQIVSTLACAWAAAATFLLVRDLERGRGDAIDPTAPFVAGMCVAGSGIALRTGQVVMADGLAVGLSATALWCAARYLSLRRGAWLVPCSVALAGGAVTRWQVGLLALPMGIACVTARRREATGAPATLEANANRLWWVAAGLAGLVVLIPQLVTAHAVPSSLEHHEWLQRWSPWNALHRDFETSNGHTHYRFPVGLFYLVRLAWPDALFPTVGLLAIVGVGSVIRERRAVDAALLVGWPLVNWAFISGIPYENPRFLWPVLPALGALAGLGYRVVRNRLATGRSRSILALSLAGSIAAGLASGAREHAHTVARKNAERASVTWLDAHMPADATLLMTGGTLIFEYYGSSKVRDTYLLTNAQLEATVERERPCFYLARPNDVGANLEEKAQLQELLRTPGLTPVATHSSLTLFRVGPAL